MVWYKYFKNTKDGRKFVLAVMEDYRDDDSSVMIDKKSPVYVKCVITNAPSRFIKGQIYLLFKFRDITIKKVSKKEQELLEMTLKLNK